MRPVDPRQQTQIPQDQWRGQRPADVARPKHLAALIVEGVRQAVLVLVAYAVAGESGGVSGGHGEVGEGGDEGN